MVATLCLLTCALAPGQSADRADWVLLPRLERGQELVYRGSFTERSLAPNVQFERGYRLEANLFVLDELPLGRRQVAFLTALTPRASRPGETPAGREQPSSVRLEVAEVDERGRLKAPPGVSLAVSLDGPPTAECGALLEVPAGKVGPGASWPADDAGRPPRTWKVAGTDIVRSTACVKLVGEQKSADWDDPRADSTAWWRQDTVWLAPRLGLAYRVERKIRRRDPARTQPTYESVTRYELDTRVNYPGRLFEDYRDVILQARRFQAEAEPLLAQPASYPTQLDALVHKITYYLDDRPRPMPYRQAVLQVRHRAEAARRGEVVPGPAAEDPAPPPAAAVGRRAPDFVVTDLVGRNTLRLSALSGRPVLLVFYNPGTEPGRRALDFARDLAAGDKRLAVLALVAAGDDALARQQHAELHLPFPVADGRGLHVSFGVTATPRLVLLDADGVVRGAFEGWGPEVAGQVREARGRLK
jgi:peroxiredoxin